MGLLEMSIIFAVIFVVVYALYKYYYLPKKAKDDGNAIRILLFEQIGKDMVFLKTCKGEEMPDENLGVYIKLGINKKVISDVANHDLFYDAEFGKCLMVCKYADDDFRVMARLKSEHWFKKVMVDEPVLDKKGKPLLDDDGEPLFDSVEQLVAYSDPIGITQEGREVMRFNREWAKRMAERRLEKASFWDKYGAYVMTAGMLLIILMSTAYNSNKFEMASQNLANAFGEKADEYLDKMESPTFIDTLIQKFDSRNTPVPPT